MLNKILQSGGNPAMPTDIANNQGTMEGRAAAAGWLQGTRAKIEDTLSANKDNRDQGYLNLAGNLDVREEKKLEMSQEAFDWKRQDVHRQQAISLGMQQAAAENGYEGVIDYLKTADPERALEFTNKKLDLDQKMLSTDTMKSLAPVQQANALVEGYGVFGRMGQALLNAPEQDRAPMYEQMKPIMAAVMGKDNVPGTLQEAVPTLLLGSGQFNPNSQLFQANNMMLGVKSEMGQTIDALSASNAKFGPNDPRTQALQQQMNNLAEGGGMTLAQIAKLKVDKQNDATTGEKGLRNEWSNHNKDFDKLTGFYSSLAHSVRGGEQIDPLSGKPQGPNDVMTMYYYAHMLSPQSTLKPGAMGTLENMAGVPDEVKVKYNQVLNGAKLSHEERGAMLDSATSVWNANKKMYDTAKSGYQDIVTNKGWNPQNVFVANSPLEQLNLGPQIPDGLVKAAQKAVAQGMPVEQANKIVQDQMSKIQQAKQTTQGVGNVPR